ncbi:nucleotidyltransferase domain-containing protein [Stigmatella sp. ncwal1]|uniref:Nucleotidyltransferase domain-containing protein n=1 Tax=Stigmatella ashevillensis TaxID=2995309 RepID=A0ABT5DDI0_9BACT|nr:nucleotidyltransferase domain-containing protein [Stigmatella ashevillena]MDC0711200.1 nucleotidyltransferase domain-containing protein [Stigmatella ashevillena]
MTDPLMTEHQTRIADRVLDEEAARRQHLVVSLTGAHAYGFPSPDSDLDLKCVHITPTAHLLRLEQRTTPAERLEVLEGVEVDYSSNELGPVLLGVLQGNGNFVERLLGAHALRGSAELESLRPRVRGVLSRRLHRHYRGFAQGQLREWEKTGFRSTKKLLYVLRTTLTGTHVLLTGEVETDLTALMDRYGFAEAGELVAWKRRGERSELSEALSERWREQTGRAFEQLDSARERSVLPEEPRETEALEAWLLDVRRSHW